MPAWLLNLIVFVLLLSVAVAAFFYIFTKGALVWRSLRKRPPGPADHVYPVYSEMWLMRLVDMQPVISAILLFQYGRLVSWITDGLRQLPLQDREVLVTSCAFGNVIPKVVRASLAAGARRVQLVDIIANELTHAQRKLPPLGEQLRCSLGDATAMSLPTGSMAANVLFFLLHELDADMKRKALAEAVRVLELGGQLFLAEFHRPEHAMLRAFSWLYFKVFEPFGLALWDVQDPVRELQALGGLRVERRTALLGNFQLVVATRL